MPPRLSMLFLLLCLTSCHVFAAPVDEPLFTISKNETCPENCLCVENQENFDILDVICSPAGETNDDPPPADISVESIIGFIEPVKTVKQETTEDLNEDVVQNASVEVGDITNMEIKNPENNTMQADAPRTVTVLDEIDTKKVEEEVKPEEDNGKELEGDSDEDEENEPEIPEVKILPSTSSPVESNFDNEVMQGDEPAKEENDEKSSEEEETTEQSDVKTEKIPEVLIGDPEATEVAKKAPPTSDEDEALEPPVNTEDDEGTSDEQEDAEENSEPEVVAQPESDVVPEPDVVSEIEVGVKLNESDEKQDDPIVPPTEAPVPEILPEESEQKLPEVDKKQMDYGSDEDTEGGENENEEPINIPVTGAPEVTVAAIIQRIQEVDSEKLLESELDNILLPDGEIITIGDQMDDAMSGKMISDDSAGTTQPQKSTASWVILGLILATFVGVVGYATVRGRMDKKKDDIIARVVPPSAPTVVDGKGNRRPPNEGTEMKVLSRPLLQPGDEENNLKEFKDNKDDLKQVVVADVPADIPYIDDSDNDKPNKVAKPPRRQAPPPPLTIPAGNVSDGPWSPTTPTLVRTRIVESPQVARVLRMNNNNNNPFDE